jgi:hypothetical protein
VDDYATSRLRARYVVDLLADDRRWDVSIDYSADAEIAMIVQLCNDANFEAISKNRDQLVVYDICDRYFATNSIFHTDEGVLDAYSRCLEVIERADALIVPARKLKDEISRLFPEKPCFYVPELVDYGASPHPVTETRSRRLLWFGHTTRGNFESARWVIDHLMKHHGYRPVLVTTPETLIRRYPAYAEYCVAWSPESLRQEMATAELCVVSHAPEEPGKSPNRFVTATMHGVPTLVSGSPSCVELLTEASYGHLAVDTPLAIDRAMESLADPARRIAYVTALQEEMWRRYAPDVVRNEYLSLFQKIWSGPESDPSY